MTVDDVRKEIDSIDQEIINLLGARVQLVEKVGKLKPNRMKIKDLRREQQVLRRLKSQAIKVGLDPEFVEKIYKQFFDYFILCQEKCSR